MRTRLLTAALIAFAGAAPIFGQATDRAATAKVLIANENKVNEAVAKGDAATFTSLMAPESIAVDGMSGFTKATDLTKTLNQLKITTWHIMNPQVMWIDDKAAVVTYTWMGAGTYMGKPVPDTTYASTVWAERNGKWLALFHHESTVEAAPAAAPAKKK
jgi:hypothetical protein